MRIPQLREAATRMQDATRMPLAAIYTAMEHGHVVDLSDEEHDPKRLTQALNDARADFLEDTGRALRVMAEALLERLGENSQDMRCGTLRVATFVAIRISSSTQQSLPNR